ncbi:MAG: M20 family metallopeptidase [bacterium]
MNTSEIQKLSDALHDEIVTLRRSFHQYPELSWHENKTAERVAGILREEGLDVTPNVCGAGLIAEISGSSSGKTVAIRADMDALPLQDAKDTVYASRIPGVMHACGHDCHMAMAIGVAKLLKRLAPSFDGKIRLIFQPSEEASPSGAEEMVKAGVMAGVDEIFAFHVAPEIEVGKIGLRAGILTAQCNEFGITIFGKSGHAARPHHSIDTVFVSNQVVSSLYDIVGSRSQPLVPAVLSIGQIHGGTKSNVIPERVEIVGSIRTIDEMSRVEIFDSIEERVSAITEAHGARYELEFLATVPSVINDSNLVDLVREAGTEILTKDGIFMIENFSMGGEDFSWYLNEAPGVLIRLGSRKPGDPVWYLHTQDFDIDERALSLGIAVMSHIVLKTLGQTAKCCVS